MELFTRALMALGIMLLGWAAYRVWLALSLRAKSSRAPGLETFRRGTPAILYFTTPQCVPCRTQQRPALKKVQMDLGEQVQVIEIDATAQPAIADYWGVLSAPTTFVIDASGQPRRVNHGVASAAKLKQQLQETQPTSRLAPPTAHPQPLNLES